MDLEALHLTTKAKQEWDSDELCIDVFMEPGSSNSETSARKTPVDLVSWLPTVANPYFNQGKGVKIDKRLWLGPKMVSGKDIAAKFNSESCVKLGYVVVVGRIRTDSKSNSKKIILQCDCHRKARPTKATKNNTHSRMTQDESYRSTCPWYLPVHYDTEHKEFYIRQNGGHNFHHSGHAPQSQMLRRHEKRLVNQTVLQDAAELLNKNVLTDVVQEFIHIKHGVLMNKHSLRKVRDLVLLDKFQDGGNTTASKLLHLLESDPNIDYVAFTGTLEQATDAVRVRKQSKRGKSNTFSSGNSSIVSQNSVTDTTPVHPPHDDTFQSMNPTYTADHLPPDAESFVKSLIKQLTTGDGTVLLAVMWVTSDGFKYHQKFPFVLGCDVTFGTNSEKRPLFRASAKTSDNKNIPFVNAFVPSQQRWVFDWIFETGLPSVLDNKALAKTSIILTDQDNQLVGTLISKLNEQSRYRIYGNAVNRLCGWHKIDRGYDMMIKSYVKTQKDRQFSLTVIQWLWHFVKHIEYRDQEVDSYRKLIDFVTIAAKDTEFSYGLVSNTEKFLRESYYPYMNFLSQRNYHATYCGNVCENSWVESDNAALKKDPQRPRPNSKLHISTHAIINHTDKRLSNLSVEATRTLQLQLLPKESDTDLESVRQILSKDIVEKKRDAVVDQYKCSKDYCFQVVEEDDARIKCFTRKRNIEISQSTWAARGPIPLYHLTREVTFHQTRRISGTKFGVLVRCSCHYYTRLKVPCRHIYSIIQEKPKAEHFGPENLKSYEVEYGENTEYTRRVDEFNDEVESLGGGLLMKTTLFELRSSFRNEFKDLNWYKEAYNHIGVDVNPNNKQWTQNETITLGSDDSTVTNVHENKVLMAADPRKQSTYMRTLQLFRETTDLAVSEEGVQVVVDALTKAHETLLSLSMRGSSSANTINSNENQIATFPDVEHRNKVVRHKPFNSPSNKKRRR